MYCKREGKRKPFRVLRPITEDERREWRIPSWIQSDEIPECCGIPMFFVGQIDDNDIWMERPKNAQLWWHDCASIYVFTCSQCLECKAVGQQY